MPEESKPAIASGAEKMVLGFVASVFTAVSLYIGAKVSSMSEEVARLSAVMESQVKLADRSQTSVVAILDRLAGIEVRAQERMTRIQELEKKVEALMLGGAPRPPR